MSRGLAFVAVAALPSLASAAQWTMVPELAVSADADTNRRLTTPPRPSEAGVISGTLAIARMSEISTLALIPRASISRYSGDDALDSEDWGVQALFRRKGERLEFDVQAGLADDSTLVTEPGETGFTEGNTRRHLAHFDTTLTQYVSTRHMLRYNLAVSDIDYDRTLGTGLVGYRYPSVGLMYLASMSPRLDLTVNVSSARLEVPLTHVESDTYGAQAGIRFRVSESFDLEARAGRTDTRSFGRTDNARSFFGSVSWHNERSLFDLSVSQDVEPSGYGLLVHADDLRLAYSLNLTERLSMNASARASRREETDVALRQYEYRYGSAQLAMAFKLDESWTVGLAGTYARQEYESYYSNADGSRIGLSLAWRPPQ